MPTARFLPKSLVALTALSLPACVHVKTLPGSPNEPRDAIVVVGEGEAYGTPNVVRLELGVEAHAADPTVAIESANAKMTAIIAALKQLGVEPKDLQTSDFSIHSDVIEPRPVEEEQMMEPKAPNAALESLPNKENAKAATALKAENEGTAQRVVSPPRPPRPERRMVYRVSNRLHITLRDPARLGEVLSQAVSAGANQAWGVTFDVEDPRPLADKARAEAVADAKRQATELARLAGIDLGRVVSISDDGGGGPVPMYSAMASRDYSGGESFKVPTESGQLTLRQRVRVVFAIDDDEED